MSADPHFDPTAKPSKDKMCTIRCGDCVKPITAPANMLEDAYHAHKLVCIRRVA